MPATRHLDREPGVGQKGYTVLIALALFATLGALPAILHALHLKISTAPPTSSDGIRLLSAPQALHPVPLPPAARPVDPTGPTATFPQVSESLEAAAVSFEDNRLRAMLHHSYRIWRPTVVDYRSALPTLLLPSGTRYEFFGGVRVLVTGQTTYTASDLIRYGAMRLLPDGGVLLKDNVFVSSGARLDLSSSDTGAVYLDNTASGSASIVAWGGNLDFRGTRQHPLTIQGWDEASMTPAIDTGTGRPYIREVAGTMTFECARVSSLGFWSGRTGGIAWTGLSTHPSYGGAILSTFTGNTYGAFVTRGRNVRFSGDLFESNQLDGLHFHRGTIGSSATFSAAVRNGASGFHVDRATQRTFLQHDVSEHNATNGFLVDGRPLVISASASGNGVAPGQGTRILNSSATGNGRTGILIEGGNQTVLKGDEVCAKITGIALRYGASNAIVDANDVRCGPRTGIRIGPAAPGSLVFGNAVSGARIAVLVISPGGSVEIDKSLITLASVFGISVRGVNSTVFGKDNVISGIGIRAVDSRADATAPNLSGSNTANWTFARNGTVLTYLEFHPLAVFWLSVAFLVLAGGLWTRRRRAPSHPYAESTRWRGFDPEPEPVPVPEGASVGAEAGPAHAGAGPAWLLLLRGPVRRWLGRSPARAQRAGALVWEWPTGAPASARGASGSAHPGPRIIRCGWMALPVTGRLTNLTACPVPGDSSNRRCPTLRGRMAGAGPGDACATAGWTTAGWTRRSATAGDSMADGSTITDRTPSGSIPWDSNMRRLTAGNPTGTGSPPGAEARSRPTRPSPCLGPGTASDSPVPCGREVHGAGRCVLALGGLGGTDPGAALTQAGVETRGLDRALGLVQARGAAAQLCVVREGQVVVDHSVGCAPDALFWIFSASKPFVALLVHLLAQRGELSLDDRVAEYWPRFGQNGKESITIRQVLQHRSGLPVARGAVRDALAMTDWNRAVGQIEQASPSWPPGEVPAYHYISYGFILGELVHQVTGASVRDFLITEFLGPLGLRDVHLGLPRALWPRHVPLRGRGAAARLTQGFVNRRSTREAVIPAAGVSANARDVARFYQALLRGGELDGIRVLPAATIEEARRPSSHGELDRFIGLPIRWSQGFQLGGPAQGRMPNNPMGRLSSPQTFGHNGSNCCIAWADPARDLVFVYLTNLLTSGHEGARNLGEVADAIIAACT